MPKELLEVMAMVVMWLMAWCKEGIDAKQNNSWHCFR